MTVIYNCHLMSSPYSDCSNCQKNVFIAFFSPFPARIHIKFMHYIWLVCWTSILNKQCSWARIISKLEWKRPLQLRQLLGAGLEALLGTSVPSLRCPWTDRWEELELCCRGREHQWVGDRQSELAACQEHCGFRGSWNHSDWNPWPVAQNAGSCRRTL